MIVVFPRVHGRGYGRRVSLLCCEVLWASRKGTTEEALDLRPPAAWPLLFSERLKSGITLRLGIHWRPKLSGPVYCMRGVSWKEVGDACPPSTFC